MKFNPLGLIVFAAFLAMVWLTVSFPGSGWVYLADAVVSAAILLHLAGFSRERAR